MRAKKSSKSKIEVMLRKILALEIIKTQTKKIYMA